MVAAISRFVTRAWRTPIWTRWLAVLGWAALIFLLSAQPGLRVSADPSVDQPIREFAHGAMYAMLTLLLGWGLAGREAPTTLVLVGAAVLAFLYGVTDEWHQTFVPSRHGRPDDLVWDGLGIAAGVVALALVRRSGWLDRR